jgi:hypothetical protein
VYGNLWRKFCRKTVFDHVSDFGVTRTILDIVAKNNFCRRILFEKLDQLKKRHSELLLSRKEGSSLISDAKWRRTKRQSLGSAADGIHSVLSEYHMVQYLISFWCTILLKIGYQNEVGTR